MQSGGKIAESAAKGVLVTVLPRLKVLFPRLTKWITKLTTVWPLHLPVSVPDVVLAVNHNRLPAKHNSQNPFSSSPRSRGIPRDAGVSANTAPLLGKTRIGHPPTHFGEHEERRAPTPAPGATAQTLAGRTPFRLRPCARPGARAALKPPGMAPAIG